MSHNKHPERNLKKEAGVTLLEMIIVLVIIGITMTMLANYMRKDARKGQQQNISAMIVRDISGVMEFVAQNNLAIINGGNTTSHVNPLYGKDGSVSANNYDNRVRNKTLEDQPDNTQNNYYSGWSAPVARKSNVNVNNGSRYLFLGSECKNKGALPYELANSMLPCDLKAGAESLELMLERVDFVNNDQSADQTDAIERVDFYLTFQAESKGEGLHFISFIKPLEEALKSASLSYLQAAVFEVSSSGKFTLVTKNNAMPLLLDDVASNIDLLDQDNNYGIRLSLNKNNEYLPSDGSVPVDKMCWNNAAGEAGPCIQALDKDRLVIISNENSTDKEPAMCWDKGTGSSTLCLAAMNSKGVNEGVGNNPDDRILHLRTSQEAVDPHSTNSKPSSLKGTTATLFANVVMENTSRKHPREWRLAYSQQEADLLADGIGSSKYTPDNDNVNLRFKDAFVGQYELVTPAVTFYQSFKNEYPSGTYPMNSDSTYQQAQQDSKYESLLNEPGAIRLPVQTCPQVQGVDEIGKTRLRKLYPRLTVALSSIAADTNASARDKNGYVNYKQQGANRDNTYVDKEMGAIAGVALQANIVVNRDIAKAANNIPEKPTGNITTTFNGPDDGSKNDWITDAWFTGSSSGSKDEPFWLISATSGTLNIDGKDGDNKVNPQSLSVVVTQWCSTIPQGGIISSDAQRWDDQQAWLLHSIIAEDTDLKFYDNSGNEVETPDHERITY